MGFLHHLIDMAVPQVLSNPFLFITLQVGVLPCPGPRDEIPTLLTLSTFGRPGIRKRPFNSTSNDEREREISKEKQLTNEN